MALPDPTLQDWQSLQRNFDDLDKRRTLGDGEVTLDDLSQEVLDYFLKLTSPASSQIKYGSTTLNVPGGASGTVANVAHGLTGTPKAWVSSRLGGYFAVGSADATNITIAVQQYDSVVGAAAVPVNWLLILG